MKSKYKIIYIIVLLISKKLEINVVNNIKYNSYENKINNINYLSKLKKVVYTILLGKYDRVHSIIKEEGYDYFMITDQNLKNNTIKNNWTILKIDEIINYSNKKEKIKKQRYYKTHPHLFFKDYDLSIYVDATFVIKGKLNEFLIRILSPNLSIYLLEHPERNSIFKESKAVIRYRKESKDFITIIQKKYKQEKFPDNNGLGETCLIVRKHNDLDCINFMEKWFQEIKNYSHRDQLSFNYIFWKSKNRIVKYNIRKITELIVNNLSGKYMYNTIIN